MTMTLNTQVYTLDTSIDPNANQYTGPAHTQAVKDLLVLRRTPAKGVATTTSVPKASATAKMTKTVTVGGVSTEIIGEYTVRYPVGAAKADVDDIRDKLGDLMISTDGDNLVWKGDINN